MSQAVEGQGPRRRFLACAAPFGGWGGASGGSPGEAVASCGCTLLPPVPRRAVVGDPRAPLPPVSLWAVAGDPRAQLPTCNGHKKPLPHRFLYVYFFFVEELLLFSVPADGHCRRDVEVHEWAMIFVMALR